MRVIDRSKNTAKMPNAKKRGKSLFLPMSVTRDCDTEPGTDRSFASHPFSHTTVSVYAWIHTCRRTMRGRMLPQEFADMTLTVFWRARPNKALLRIAFEKDRSSTIELKNFPLFWPRQDRSYPIPTKKSPNFGLSCLYRHAPTYDSGFAWDLFWPCNAQTRFTGKNDSISFLFNLRNSFFLFNFSPVVSRKYYFWSTLWQI